MHVKAFKVLRRESHYPSPPSSPSLPPSLICSRLYVQQKALVEHSIGEQLAHEKHQRHFRSIYLRDGIACFGVTIGKGMVHGLREGGRNERMAGGVSAPLVLASEDGEINKQTTKERNR